MSVHWFESKTSERQSKSETQLKKEKEKNNKIHAIVQKKTTDRARTQPDTVLGSMVVSVEMKRTR